MSRRVTAQEFVKAWQECDTIGQVARKIGCKSNACRVRAFRYRENGVPLKVHQFVDSQNIDWEELAEYAKNVLPKA